jgi:putative ABC transport system permease protein
MFVSNALLIALREIRRNLARAGLTVFAVVIGIAAVVSCFTLGQGTTQAVREEFSNLGSDLLVLRPGVGFGPRAPGTPNFNEDDVDAIRAVPFVVSVTPVRNSLQNTRFQQNARDTTVIGTTLDYFKSNRWQLAEGRLFSDAEQESGAAVCVIGETVRKELFGGTNSPPVGARVQVGRVSCEIIGVLNPKGQMGWRDQDDTIVTPLRTIQRRIAGRDTVQDISNIQISISPNAGSEVVIDAINGLMRERRKLAPTQDNNFSIMDTRQITNSMSSASSAITMLLAVVAGASLLVGGICIMNTMLVSVTERTREIGVRMAVGARAREVLAQFLIEAVLIAAVGGLGGIICAALIGLSLAPVLQVSYQFYPGINLIALLFSAFIGVLFGYMPAHRAANLDPIEALRHE